VENVHNDKFDKFMPLFLEAAEKCDMDINDIKDFILASTVGVIARHCYASKENMDQVFDKLRAAILEMTSHKDFVK